MIQSHTTALTNSKAGFFFSSFFSFFSFCARLNFFDFGESMPRCDFKDRSSDVFAPIFYKCLSILPIDRDVSVVSPADSGSSSVLCSIEIQHAETCLTYVIHHVQSRRMLLYNAVQVCARDRSWFWNIQMAVKLEIVKSFTWLCILGRMALFSPGSGRTTCYSNIWTAFF